MKSNYDVRRIVLVTVIGLCEAIKEGGVSLEEAEHILFSPRSMRILSFDKEIKDIIHMATELENIQSLLPDLLIQEIEEIKKLAINKLKQLSDYKYNNENWLDAIFS